MNNKLRISVIGCGWLGLPLAETLLMRGYTVKGTTTTEDKLQTLKKKGIDSYLVHFGLPNPAQAIGILDCDVLIINIPPGSRSPGGPESYHRMADYLTDEIPGSRINKVILVSSTSVYSETNRSLSEGDIPEPDSVTGKLLLEVENQFLELEQKKVCVLRASGLVGPERHPGRFFRNKGLIPNGLAPVNLIHREDVIGIIIKLIESKNTQGIYNACSPLHPTKQDFYGLAAEVCKQIPPVFIPEKTSWKIICSSRVKDELNYVFKHPDLREWLKDQSCDSSL
jgi:nucleoside-diphosphate-sugar epimerase